MKSFILSVFLVCLMGASSLADCRISSRVVLSPTIRVDHRISRNVVQVRGFSAFHAPAFRAVTYNYPVSGFSTTHIIADPAVLLLNDSYSVQQLRVLNARAVQAFRFVEVRRAPTPVLDAGRAVRNTARRFIRNRIIIR